MEILETSNGKECLQKFDSFNPHLVILDLKMPELDRMQVLKSVMKKGLLQGCCPKSRGSLNWRMAVPFFLMKWESCL
ncbi:hypothetical protein [Koleobacter methoxysyntrophicus]|uniref:hypothetical protein n=1 Tax=Koleobacter methoxysyntrophicus TaxID=2751313 RepID=UPI003BAF590F